MDGCNVVQLRRGARRAALMAIAKSGLSDPRVDAALAALASGRTGDGRARDSLLRLLEELDNAAWAARERVEAGGAPGGGDQRGCWLGGPRPRARGPPPPHPTVRPPAR